MSAWDIQEDYFSGQGIVLVGLRDRVTGKPKGLRPVGNVSDLKISVATTTEDHQESKTGQRGVDLRLVKETKVSFASTWENFMAANLALLLRGTTESRTGATVTALAVAVYAGLITPLEHIKVSAVAVKQGAVSLTAYTNDATPWDYKLNADAGSILLNTGAGDKLGVPVTGITVGATTTLTFANTLEAGETVTAKGFTGADAAFINGMTLNIISATSSAIVVDLDTTAKVFTVTTAKVFYDGMPAAVDYTYEDQVRVDALTAANQDLFIRFEGLNTVAENAPVIVEIFKVTADPLKELALIADKVQDAVVEGTVLSDPTRTDGGSTYFRVLKQS